MLIQERPTARRCFVTSSYLPDSQSRLSPKSPAGCPKRESGPDKCHIVSNGWRSRKVGPFAWLKQFLCLFHGVKFTVYPCGMIPFGRRSFIDAPNFMEAVVDGANGAKWPTLAPQQGSTFKTQKRHILFLSKLFGVEPSLTPAERLAAAMTLHIPTIHLQDGATKIREGPTFAGRAQVVMGILNLSIGKVISLGATLHRGHESKLWGVHMMDERDVSLTLPSYHQDDYPPSLSPA